MEKIITIEISAEVEGKNIVAACVEGTINIIVEEVRGVDGRLFLRPIRTHYVVACCAVLKDDMQGERYEERTYEGYVEL